MRILSAFIVGIFTFTACYGSDVITPPTGPGTEYPCGVWGVECSHDAKGSMCCPQDHICGTTGPFSQCTPGYCCYDGDHWPLAARDAGPPEPELQRRVYRR